MADNPGGLERIARMPPGAAMIGIYANPATAMPEVVWLLREESHRIKGMAGKKVRSTINVLIVDNVAIIPSLVCVGEPKPGNIWETWFNVHKRGSENWLKILARQAERAVWFIGDSGTVEGTMRIPNDTTKQFARRAIEQTSALPPWSESQYSQAREQLYRRCPDVVSLWTEVLRGNRSLPPAQEAASEFGTISATAAAEAGEDDVLSAAESILRGMYGQVQTVLNCLAPLSRAVSLRGLAEYAQHLRLQPALSFMPLHLLEAAITQSRRRQMLRPHPADAEYLLIAADFTLVLRERLRTSSTPAVRQALEWAFHATYAHIAAGIQARSASGKPGEKDAAMAAVAIECENLAVALDYGLARRLPVSNIHELLNSYYLDARHFQRGAELGEKVLARLEQGAGDDLGKIRVLRDLALHQERLGKLAEAEASCRKALGLCASRASAPTRDDQACLGSVYEQLGNLAAQRRLWKRAKSCFGKALTIAAELAFRGAEAQNHYNLARLAATGRDWPRARAHGRKALQIFTVLGDRRRSVADVSFDWATWAASCGRLNEARKYFRQALAFFVESGDKPREAAAHQQLGYLAHRRARYRAAAAHHRKAVKIFFALGDRRSRATSYNDLAMAVAMLHAAAPDDMKKARKLLFRALKLAQTIEDRFGQGMARFNLGRVAVLCGKPEKAQPFFEKALELYQGSENPLCFVQLNLEMGFVAYELGQWEEGRLRVATGLRDLRDCSEAEFRESTLRRVGMIWRDSGDAALLADVAEALNTTPREAKQLLRKMLARK